MSLRAAGFSIDTTHNMMNGTRNHGCRSPYNAPSSDDSEDDGASDYAAHPRQRPLQNHDESEEDITPDNILHRFYETVDAPCQMACQGNMEAQLDLLTVRACVVVCYCVCVYRCMMALADETEGL